MECKPDRNEIFVLMPAYFKKVGLALIILSLVPAIIIKSANIELAELQKKLFLIFTFDIFILGLWFIAWSKDKVEDELTFAIRLKTAAWTFFSAAFYVIIRPLFDVIFKVPVNDLTGRELIIMMFFIYLIMYYFQKSRR